MMLTKLGRLSAAVAIAGAGLLGQSEPVAAQDDPSRPCTPNEWEQARTLASTYWYYDYGYWCGSADNGSCWVDEEGSMWYTATFYFYGEDPCPQILPGGGG
jgi:hypothetical protein